MRADIFDGRPAPSSKDIWGEPLTTAQTARPIPRQAQIPPFWQMKPPGGIDLYATARGTLPNAAGAQIILTPSPPTWTILPSYKGTLANLTVTVQAPLVTLDIVFTLLANRVPVQGWDRFVPPQVAANAIILPFNGPLQLPQNVTLEVLVTNNSAAGPWNVEASLAGWMWPLINELNTFGVEQG